MPHDEIVARLSLLLVDIAANSSDNVYVISMQSVLSEIARRLGDDALNLSAQDILLALDEVRAAIAHHLDEREFIAIGLDTWDITRTL